MLLIVILIPFISAVIALIFFKTKVVWWEYLMLTIPPLLLVVLFQWICLKSNQTDERYETYYVNKVTYYEPWNERKTRTVTYTVKVGKTTQTRHRVEHYTEYHPAEYVALLNDSSKIQCSKEVFENIGEYYGTQKQFRDMHRQFYTIDGNAYEYYKSNDTVKYFDITKSAVYINPIQDSKSIFTHNDITKEKAEKMGLFEYPKVKDYTQDFILGVSVPDKHSEAIKYLNTRYGYDKGIKLFILFFKDKEVDITEYQKDYWRGGNDNELVVCLGYDTETKKISWCECFSWCDEPVLETATKHYFLSHPVVNLIGYKNFIEPYIQNEWNKKDFGEFEYIDHEMSVGQEIVLFILVMIYCVGVLYWVVINDEKYSV